MDKKVELQIISITNSQVQRGAFTMQLGEVDGERSFPVVIGPAEAHSIAICLRGDRATRPLTHDLFTTTLVASGIGLLHTLIYKAEENVFYSYVYFKKDNEIIRIDARTSDAVALAVRMQCPIFIYESILNRMCPHPQDEESICNKASADDREAKSHPSAAPPMTLEEQMKRAIQEENYELAAKLRDRINTKNQKQ